MLPLIPIALGLGAVSAGAALHAWLTGAAPDPWDEKDVFNNRMREMHGLALALNNGFSTCAPIRKDPAQLQAWRSTRDSFSAFYRDTGTLNYSGPSSEQIAQAKSYASKFFFWQGEYTRLKCGGAISPVNAPTDPYDPTPKPPETPIDYVSIIKWSAIGIGGLYALKTINDLFGKRA